MRHTKQIFAGLFSRIARSHILNYRNHLEECIDLMESVETCPYVVDCKIYEPKKNCEGYNNCQAYHFYQRYGKDWRELGI